jgi:hypothetical protein
LHLSKELFFLNSCTTWASFNFSGKMELFIDLFIKFVIGLTIAGFFHPSLSAFRSGYGCQTALLKIIEDWKKALDENKFVAAILMDLSKAFDCLLHKLLINKLDAYRVSESALKLIKNYLSNRKQCVKIGNIMSEWEDIYFPIAIA